MKDHERGMSEMPLAGKGPYDRWALFVFRKRRSPIDDVAKPHHPVGSWPVFGRW